MPEKKETNPDVQALADSYDRLMYMVKTTAPHLQTHMIELRELTLKAIVRDRNVPPLPAGLRVETKVVEPKKKFIGIPLPFQKKGA